jgi:predicted alpha/beta superfamily hydrolase
VQTPPAPTTAYYKPWYCPACWLIGCLLLAGTFTEDSAIRAQNGTLILDSLPLAETPDSPYRTLRIWLPPGHPGSACTGSARQLISPSQAQDSAQYSPTWPVIYLMDGQNLFDEASSYVGEWQLDECLDSRLSSGLPVPIAVGIDHGGSKRVDEYSPLAHPNYGGGQADAHRDFLIRRVLPHVEQCYGASRQQAERALGGSSLGALFALYAASQHPQYFGLVLSLSPSFYFMEGRTAELFPDTLRSATRFFARMGTLEGWDQGDPVLRAGDLQLYVFALDFAAVYNNLLRRRWPASQLNWALDPAGRHNERWWAGLLPEALSWWLDPVRDSDP